MLTGRWSLARPRNKARGATRHVSSVPNQPLWKRLALIWRHWMVYPLALVSLGVLVPGALVALPDRSSGPWFPLRKVEVSGELRRLDPELLQQRLAPAARGSFFDLDVGAVQGLVSDLPWVESVRIGRKWPDQLAITIIERQPQARWGRAGLIDQQGEFFSVAAMAQFDALPLLSGPVGSEGYLFSSLQKLREQLTELPQPLTEVHLDERGIWRLVLADGVELLFRGEPDQVSWAKLFAVYRDQLREHWPAVRTIDLRYSDGVAVAFAPDTILLERDVR